MKKIIVWLAVLLCTFGLAAGVSAEEILFALDWADLLTAEEEAALNTSLAQISERNGANILVAAVESTEGASAQSFADDLYDAGLSYFGLMDGTEDGVLFLVAMNQREWAISTTGRGITAITEQALDQMEDYIIPLLSQGEYYSAFTEFADLTDAYFELAAKGGTNPDVDYINPYYPGVDIQYEYYGSAGETVRYGPSFGPQWIFIALIAGFLIALIPMGMLKSQLSSVHR